jgi:hypothetical protein
VHAVHEPVVESYRVGGIQGGPELTANTALGLAFLAAVAALVDGILVRQWIRHR